MDVSKEIFDVHWYWSLTCQFAQLYSFTWHEMHFLPSQGSYDQKGALWVGVDSSFSICLILSIRNLYNVHWDWQKDGYWLNGLSVMLQENEEGILIFRFAVKADFVILWFWLTLWAWQRLKPAKFKSKICHFPNSLLFMAHIRSAVVWGHGSHQSPEADFQLMPWLRCMSYSSNPATFHQADGCNFDILLL